MGKSRRADMGEERSNPKLRRSGVAARIGDAGSFGDKGAVNEFREAISPCWVETIIGGEVDNDALGAAFVDGVHPGFSDAVREGHDPDVNSVFFGEFADVLGRQILICNFMFLVAFQFLTSKFARGDMSKVHIRVSVKEIYQCLASVTTGAWVPVNIESNVSSKKKSYQ